MYLHEIYAVSQQEEAPRTSQFTALGFGGGRTVSDATEVAESTRVVSIAFES